MPTKARTALAEIQPNDTSTDLELQKALDKVTKKPTSRKRKPNVDDGTEAKKTKTAKSDAMDKKREIADISAIHLDGEEAHAVEVYDTCDMVRSKIKLFMKQHPKETNASLARRIGVPANGLSRFCEKKGYDRGNTSAAFYSAYVFLEKLRIAQDKPKSKDRIKMEEVWASQGGSNITTASNHKGISCFADDHLSCNKYGEATITSTRSGSTRIGAM